MPLKVVLRPGEKMIVNGAVLGAGDRAATLFLHNQAQFLRGREMLTPERATTTLGCFQLAIQSLYLADPDAAPAARQALAEAAAAAIADRPQDTAEITECAGLAMAGEGYRAMRRAARLLAAS
jgi:flagellar protein FlbT